VSHPGFYLFNQYGYKVWEGFEATYPWIGLKQCAHGNCDSRLRPKEIHLCE